jgi:hypothetical protein
MNLTKQNWPLGWTPSADSVNGDPSGLLRMDNLQMDETGVLSLVRGIQQLNGSSLGDYVSDIYSKVIGASETIWVGLNGLGLSVKRSKNGTFSDAVTIGAGDARAVFGDCLGQVLITAGALRKKDDGTTVNNLGITYTPDAGTWGSSSGPAFAINAQPQLDLTSGTWESLEGHDPLSFPPSYQENVDADTLRGVVRMKYAGPVNTYAIGDGPRSHPENDKFYFLVQLHDSNLFTNIRVEFILDDSIDTPQNYFWHEWPLDSTPEYLLGINQQSHLSANRGDFFRQGSDTTLDWDHVTAIRFTAIALADNKFLVGEQKFSGGVKGVLNGAYAYRLVFLNDNGVYQAKSEVTPPSPTVLVINGSVSIFGPTSGFDTQINKMQVFRRSINVASDNPISGPEQAVAANNPNIPVTGLNNWFLVGTVPFSAGVQFDDNTSDAEALELNTKANLFLQSLQNVPDTILGMEGLFNERMLYLTASTILLGDQLNPDAIDLRYTIKAFGDVTEKNLWLRKLTNNVLILGTTKNLYEISGTLLILPDGTVDATIIPIGENYPPLCSDNAATEGSVFYVASDGIRLTNGSNSILISPQLNLLFQGLNRHGIPPVAIFTNNNARYPMAIAKGKLFISIPTQDGDRRFFLYDIKNSRWSLRVNDPIAVYATATDRLLLGFGYNQNIYEMDKGLGVTDSSGSLIQGQTFYLQTVFDANGQPRNRKDTFTLKIICDTGGKSVDVYIGKDNDTETMTFVGSLSHSGTNTAYFPLDQFTLGFRYAIRINANGAPISNLPTVFKLNEITIEYDPRPEQLDYLRIQNTNLGSYSRKRITSFAFVIDTLGNTINFVPYIDNTPNEPDTVNNPVKLTHVSYFDQETIGTDIGGILSGGVFEYYGLNLEETISEKLPTPTRFLVIPNSDYGTPNRKRHTSYKFQINTRGQNVVFTPKLDGVNYAPATYNMTEKRIVEYFFDTALGDIIGIDIGGTLDSSTLIPFEFYGVVTPQQVEVLPPRLEFFRIPNTNYGVAARKRIRTIPVIIDTYGTPVTFTPILDGVLQSNSTTFSSSGKTTLYHYFIDDVFPTDIGGQISSVNSGQPFEFYELGVPENVEVLPVPKRLDQLNMRFDRLGKLFNLRTRLIAMGDLNIPFAIYESDLNAAVVTNVNPVLTGNIPVTPFVDNTWETQLPKSINGTIFRIVLGPTDFPFHRFDMQVRVAQSGMESDSKWVPIR